MSKLIATLLLLVAVLPVSSVEGQTPECSTELFKVNAQSIVYILADKRNIKTKSVDSESGTGFIVSPSGYVVTSDHVVQLNQDQDKVTIEGSIGTQKKKPDLDLSVIAEDSKDDLALLKFDDTSQKYFPVLLGSSDTPVDQGTKLCSIGFPYKFERNGSTGIVTGTNKKNDNWLTNMGSNPGDSGSPVFLTSGEVVAVKIGGYDKAQDINEITPISPILSQARRKEKDCTIVKLPDDPNAPIRVPPSKLSVVIDGRERGEIRDHLDFACGKRSHSLDFTIEWLAPQPGQQGYRPGQPTLKEYCSDRADTTPGTDYTIWMTIGPKFPSPYAPMAVMACQLKPR